MKPKAIKNPKSQTAIAAFSLNSKFKLTMSGTPIENRLEELWSQMNFLCRGLIFKAPRLLKKYADPISKGDQATTKDYEQGYAPLFYVE